MIKMIDLNQPKPEKKQEEPSAPLGITAIVIAAWIVWAFCIGGMLH